MSGGEEVRSGPIAAAVVFNSIVTSLAQNFEVRPQTLELQRSGDKDLNHLKAP